MKDWAIKIIQFLKITLNRFPKECILENELSRIFPEDIRNDDDELEKFCFRVLDVFYQIVIDKHLYETNWTTFAWKEAREQFIREIEMDRMSINYDALYILIFEEFWWRLHGFHDWKSFAFIPTQLELQKDKPHQEGSSIFINYYDLEVKSTYSAFKIGKQAHDFIRFFVFGYHYAFPHKEILHVKWWSSQLLNIDSEIKNLVLIDLDNAGKAVSLLAGLKYPNTKFFGFCGTGLKETSVIKDAVANGVLEVYRVDLLKPHDEMDSLERFLDKFYLNGYYKKYKNAADYALSAFAGAIHYLAPLNVRVWVVTQDDGLDWPNRHLCMRGRVSQLVTQDDLVSTLNSQILFKMDGFVDRIVLKDVVFEQIEKTRVLKDLELSVLTKKDYDQSWYLEDEKERNDCEDIISDVISKGLDPKLVAIKFRGMRLGIRGIKSLIGFEFNQLTRLELRGARITDSIGIFLSQMVAPRLKHVDLASCMISDSTVGDLAELIKRTPLEVLDLRWNKIGPIGAIKLASALFRHETLHSLILRDNKIGYDGLHALLTTKNDSLVNIDVYRTCGEDFGYIFEEKIELTALKSLDLSGNSFRTGRAPFANYLMDSCIAKVILDYVNIGNDGALYLSKVLNTNKNLVILSLARSLITDIGAQYIAHALETNESLTFLDLQRNSISDVGMIALADALGKNKTLWTLDLMRNHIGDHGIIHFSTIKNSTLSHLDFYNNLITHRGCEALLSNITNFPNVTQLNIGNNCVGDHGMFHISQNLSNITHLTLDECDIKEFGLRTIYKHIDKSSLYYLKLSQNKIGNMESQIGITELSKWIPKRIPDRIDFNKLFKSDLSYLDLSGNLFGDDGLNDLVCSSLIESTSLAYLNLSNNFLTKQGFNTIAKLFQSNTSIVTFMASNNSAHDEGFSVLCDSLRENKTLTVLNLDSNNISSVGLTDLAALLLRKESLLACLSLQANVIDDTSMDVFSRGLQACDSIFILNMERNKLITQKGRKILLEQGSKVYSQSGYLYSLQIFI